MGKTVELAYHILYGLHCSMVYGFALKLGRKPIWFVLRLRKINFFFVAISDDGLLW